MSANYGGNILAGAGTGAAMGSAAGPWGALIGGAAGALAGLFSAFAEADDEKKKQEILDEAKRQFNLDQDQVVALMNEYYDNPENFLGTQDDVKAYRDAVQKYNPQDYVYDFGEFGYDKTVDDFVNPYRDRIVQSASDKVQHSAAGAGVGRGTGAANAIAQAVADKDDELYRTALQQYNTDRAQSYSEWSGNIQAMQNKLNQLRAATDTKVGMQGNLAQDYLNTQQNRFSDQIAAQRDRSSGNLQLANMSLMI